MLNPEIAQERLKPFHLPDVNAHIAAAAVSDDLRTICWGLLSHDAEGKAVQYPQSREVNEQAQRRLVALSDPDRQTVFGTFFPGIARHVEAAWQLHRRLPYQTGWTRKPFRGAVPGGETDAARLVWLQTLITVTLPYGHQPITWFAAWTPYLSGYHGDAFGVLLAAAVENRDQEGDEVFATLIASGRGEHEIGAMGRHVSRALLVANRPEGWEFIEKLLLAAQRQEGLRQAVLEAIDEAHPEAFRRMLTLIREHDLVRFSATIRAIDVWLGFGWDAVSARFASAALAQLEIFLRDQSACVEALALGNAQATYLALWATAFQDAPSSIPFAQSLLSDPDAERRAVAVLLLTQLGLSEARKALVPALEDADLRVALVALRADHAYGSAGLEDASVFERLERLLARMPAKSRSLEPLVWEWMTLTTDRGQVADALTRHLGSRSAMHLLPHLGAMTSYGRAAVVEKLAEDKTNDPVVRDTLLRLIGDTTEYVRGKAIEAIKKVVVTEGEALRLEGLLTRKSSDLRRGVLSLLLAQSDHAACESARRLLQSKDPLTRIAGLEVLQQMVKGERGVTPCRAAAAEYRTRSVSRNAAEEAALNIILDTERVEPTLDNGLGLFDPIQCSPRILPAGPNKVSGAISTPEPLITPAAAACLHSLDAWIQAHRETPLKVHGQDETLLGNLQWGFPHPTSSSALGEDHPRPPLWDLWDEWERTRPAAHRDADGLELLRALAAFQTQRQGYSYHTFDQQAPWWLHANAILFADAEIAKLAHANTVSAVLAWLLHPASPPGAVDALLDAVETTLTLLPEHALGTQHGLPLGWLTLARRHRQEYGDEWTPEHHVRLWRLTHWLDSDKPGATRQRPPFEELLAAHQYGAANDADVMDQLIGRRPTQGNVRYHFGELSQLTGHRPSPLCEAHPLLREMADRCRDRVLDIELTRGELPTAASAPALALRSVEGVEPLIRLLRALGTESLSRGHQYGWWSADNLTKGAIFSHLLRISFPARSDTPQQFAERVQSAKIAPKRLVELAVYAPQWAGFVGHALESPLFAEAVWWLHAHTKDMQWAVDQEIRDLWAAQTSERTPLSAQSLIDGAVDVAWFHRIHDALGPAGWAQVDEAAKYASGGGGHKRAQLFADAMLGRVGKDSLIVRIQLKRHADAVRALGLVPLAEGGERDADVLARYQILQEFQRGSRQFGAQRQASEKLAGGIGLENLARTAGFPDPIRLEWSMEAQAVQDLAQGPVVAVEGDVMVALSINEWGAPELAVTKKGKQLKAIPPAIKKSPAVAELTARRTEIERQASRMRLSLEGAMCRGDQFAGAELRQLLTHPILAPLLGSLVLVSPDGLSGYPVEGGARLEGLNGATANITAETRLRIAHPHDLLETGQWHDWQRDCFLRERIQPFKQVFRELYVATPSERVDGNGLGSRRYAGHQVKRSQAFALLGKRGWVGNPYEGDARRTFHDVGLTASVGFDYGFTTPAEVEGLTVDQVVFTRRGEWKSLDLGDVPPRVFSEAMRDLDLVVSVAHQGGVDPEASASTVEMRRALLREVCGLMKLGNVRLQNAHAMIDGHLGTYSVHLGSAVVHRQPGGHLCIVPVHSHHRGRLFLPFADDDPRTAEVLSKVLLLARDKEIKDPTILEQILAG